MNEAATEIRRGDGTRASTALYDNIGGPGVGHRPPGFKLDRSHSSMPRYMIFSRTDLRKAVSGAKLDVESDFDVHLAVAPPKSIKNDENTAFQTEKILICFFVL